MEEDQTQGIQRSGKQINKVPVTREVVDHFEAKHIDLDVLQRAYSEINTQEIHHDAHHLRPIVVIIIDTLRRDFVNPESAPIMTEFLNEPEVSFFQNSRAAASSTAHSLFGFFFGIFPHLRYQLLNTTMSICLARAGV